MNRASFISLCRATNARWNTYTAIRLSPTLTQDKVASSVSQPYSMGRDGIGTSRFSLLRRFPRVTGEARPLEGKVLMVAEGADQGDGTTTHEMRSSPIPESSPLKLLS